MSESDLHGRRFNDFRNRVFSQMTQERFYSLWLEGSSTAVLKEMRRLGLLPGSQKAEASRQKAEVRGQKSEVEENNR